jgi:glutaredoxin
MTSLPRHRAAAPLALLVPLAAVLLMVAAPSQAQYKVIGTDGKTTYSDREPSAAEGRVSALGARTATQSSEPELPFELRQIASKYPVTLYTTTGACEPCASARALLRQRGIPYSERQVTGPEDAEALERLAGAREAPTLMIGSQALRGLANDVWNSYLDAAGYPKQSRLPSTYQYRAPTPIVDRREPAVARSDAAPAPANAPTPAAPAVGTGGIRF